MDPEEYTLSNVDCPLGTVVGPGRYGMHWVARQHTINPNGSRGTTFRMTLPSDMLAVANKPEPDSVAEVLLRRNRRQRLGTIDNT